MLGLGFAASSSSDGVFLCIRPIEDGAFTSEQQMLISDIIERLAGAEHTEGIWQVDQYSLGQVESLMEERGLEYSDSAQASLDWAKEDGYFGDDDVSEVDEYAVSMESESYHDMDDYD